MSRERQNAERIEDLEVPAAASRDVKGGVAVGDVNGDGLDVVGPAQTERRLPGLHKTTDVTLKRG